MNNSFFVQMAIIVSLIYFYFVGSKLLHKYNIEKYNRPSILAWIPFARLYLLGKFTIHKIVGIFLIILFFLSGNITYTVDNVEKNISILPSDIASSFLKISFAIDILLFVILFIKQQNLESKNNNNIVNKYESFNQDDAIQKSLQKTPTLVNDNSKNNDGQESIKDSNEDVNQQNNNKL